jgi:hypothetical protein
MKVIAVVMILIGVAIGAGAALELLFYGPDSTEFWVGVLTTPAGLFFVVAGVLLWLRGRNVRRTVLLAAFFLATATTVATVLQVMGPPATLIGMIGGLVVAAWYWRTRDHKKPQNGPQKAQSLI